MPIPASNSLSDAEDLYDILDAVAQTVVNLEIWFAAVVQGGFAEVSDRSARRFVHANLADLDAQLTHLAAYRDLGSAQVQFAVPRGGDLAAIRQHFDELRALLAPVYASPSELAITDGYLQRIAMHAMAVRDQVDRMLNDASVDDPEPVTAS